MKNLPKNEKTKRVSQKHTPGPWIKERGGISAQWDTGETVGIALTGVTRWTGNNPSEVVKQQRMSQEDEANARLIAAAPDLLEAAKAAVRRCDALEKLGPGLDVVDKPLIENLRAAIAKAETGGR